MLGSAEPDGGPQRRLPWWQSLTPLAADCEVALEKLHCTPGEYYKRTTAQERLLIRLHLAMRGEQQRMQEQLRQQRAEVHAYLQQQFRTEPHRS